MSWSALAWATDSDLGSSTTKFILILLANKADENFSCYPSIRTLMAESDAGRSTVLRALRDLEERGFISRRPQFHDSGARRSTRYFLNHPQAPHFSAGPDAGPPGPDLTPPGPDPDRTPSQRGTETVSQRHPPGVPQRDPLNPSSEPPSEPGANPTRVLQAVATAWRLSARHVHPLLPAVTNALADGWSAAALTEHLIQNQCGVRDPMRVLARRLTVLPPPRQPTISVPWCGECEDSRSRTISVTLPDGTEAAQLCPQCSPQLHRHRTSARNLLSS
jgi:Helix-turn-helix domain